MSELEAARGERARLAAGIDGTMGDAQDVPHDYLPSSENFCLICGLAQRYRMHT